MQLHGDSVRTTFDLKAFLGAPHLSMNRQVLRLLWPCAVRKPSFHDHLCVPGRTDSSLNEPAARCRWV